MQSEFQSPNPYVQPANERGLLAPPEQWRASWEKLCAQHPEHDRVLEVGCSHGHWMENQFKRKAPWVYLGVDYKFKESVVTHDRILNNSDILGSILKVSAQDLTRYLKPEEFQLVVVQFPDPWPKRRSRKHRFCTQDFIQHIFQWLKPGGIFFFKTDVVDYFEDVYQMTPGVIWSSRQYDQSTLYDPELVTPFERIFMNQSLPIHALMAQKYG